MVAEHPALDRPPSPGFLNLVTSSSAVDLLALFHARSTHGVRPSERSSSRAAVRRLRRRCPLVVGTPPRPARTMVGSREHRSAAPNLSPLKWAGRRSVPRLQGFAPHESPPPRLDGLGRTGARSSPGIHPLRGFPPHRNGAAFTAPPLMRFPVWAQAAARVLFRVLLTGEVGSSLSRPPTSLGFRHLVTFRGSSIPT